MNANCSAFLLIVALYLIRKDVSAGRKNTDADEYLDLSEKGCGKVKILPSRQSKIVNGNDCSFGAYPWQVAFLEYNRSTLKTVYCGGSLITDQWILTAAHCFEEGTNLEEYFARLGEHDLLSSTNEPLKHVDRGLAEIIIHPEFDKESFHFDIELVKMESPVNFQKNIQPICLYNQNKLLIGKILKATGWGVIFEDGVHPAILQEVALPVIRNKDCEKMFLEEGEVTEIGMMFICAGYKHGKFDTCSGDSGGPLQMKLKNGKWALVGIVSWGFGCGRYQKPGLFTRVSYVSSWIADNIREDEPDEDYSEAK